MTSHSLAQCATPEIDSPRFEDLGLNAPFLRALREAAHERPTPIQVQAIPPALAGRDVLGCAQTGTGKTAAFSLPLLQRLSAASPRGKGSRRIRALILSPTRELASQIEASLESYGAHTQLRHAVIFGGVAQRQQVRALRDGIDILVATPGRLCDLMAQRLVDFSAVEVFILDEADRMLDQGFLPDLRRIIAALPRERQNLLFSATMPDALRPLADRVLTDPVRIEAAPVASTPDQVEESVYFVSQKDKRGLLAHLLEQPEITRAIVFTRTKRGADRVAMHIDKTGVPVESIHGDKAQNVRERTLRRFQSGSLRVLVATDVAARGIHVNDVSHVINYDLPNEAEGYVHRIGRTARAGATGTAISFCSVEERPHLMGIERLTRRRVPVVGEHPFAQVRPGLWTTDTASPPALRTARPGRRFRPPRRGR